MKKWAPLTERSSEDLRRCPCPSHSSGQVARAVQLTRSAQVSLDVPTCLCSLPPCPSSLEQGALWQLEQQRERWQEGTPRTREESTPRSLLPPCGRHPHRGPGRARELQPPAQHTLLVRTAGPQEDSLPHSLYPW